MNEIVQPKEISGAQPITEEDDKIYITLLDLDTKETTAALGPLSWQDRSQFFQNAMSKSLDDLAVHLKMFKERSDVINYMELVLLAIHEKIFDVLSALGAATVPDIHAARLLSLSSGSGHRDAARKFLVDEGWDPPFGGFETGSSLTIFNKMSISLRPGLSESLKPRGEIN